jgi:regulatory protein YycH of two-component signal transduction system YycFG
VNQLSIIAGIKPASADEQEKAISEVFKMLLMFRSANRIEGKIISNDLEKRIQELEKTVKNQGKLVEQITGFLFKPKNKNKKARAS